MPRTHAKTYYSQRDDDADDFINNFGGQSEGGQPEDEAAGGAAGVGEDEIDENADEIDIFQQWALLPKLTTMYRTTTLGKVLMESLEELVSKGRLPAALSNRILGQFDRTIMNTLRDKLHRNSRLGFQAEQLKTYRYLNGIWTFVLYGVEFRKRYSFLNIDKMKIVAVEKKGPARRKKRWGGKSGDNAAGAGPQAGKSGH